MTFKRCIGNRRGDITLGWIALLGAAAMMFLVTTLTQINKQSQLTRKDTFEAGVMLIAQSYASLFKIVAWQNFQDYVAGFPPNPPNGWTACVTDPVTAAVNSYNGFLKILSQPPPACRSVPFRLAIAMPAGTKRFTFPTSAANPAIPAALDGGTIVLPTPQGFATRSPVAGRVVPGSQSIPLQALLNTNLYLIEASGKTSELASMNNSNVTLTVVDFSTDPTRNLIVGNLHVDFSSNMGRNLAAVKNIRFFDGNPTPQTCQGAYMCPASPGQVCCPGGLNISYLERGTGRAMVAQLDCVHQTLAISESPRDPQDPKLESLKNLAGGPFMYIPDHGPTPPSMPNLGSYCIPNTGDCRVNGSTQYARDAATGPGNLSYYLIADGRIVSEKALVPPVFLDPKIVSIAYDKSWFLLWADGTVWQGKDINNIAYDNVAFSRLCLPLPNAKRLVMGLAPPPIP